MIKTALHPKREYFITYQLYECELREKTVFFLFSRKKMYRSKKGKLHALLFSPCAPLDAYLCVGRNCATRLLFNFQVNSEFRCKEISTFTPDVISAFCRPRQSSTCRAVSCSEVLPHSRLSPEPSERFSREAKEDSLQKYL